MAYEARRNDSDDEKARADANNANNIRNAADVAIATKNPYAVAAGAAVKGLDKVTGGKSTEALGKGLTRVNKMAPGGKEIQDLSNKLSESGASDTIGKAASYKNGMSGGAGTPGSVGNATNKAATTNAADMASKPANNRVQEDSIKGKNNGGGQSGSLPSSSGGTKNNNGNDKTGRGESGNSPKAVEEREEKTESTETKSKGMGSFFGSKIVITVSLIALPFVILIFILILIAGSVTGIISDYEDAFGMSKTLGGDTGDVFVTPSSQEQQDFYDRISSVKEEFLANGKDLDAMKIIAIYHTLKADGADLEYKTTTKTIIREWANYMFTDEYYDEEAFKENLINKIIPKYLPGKSKRQKEELAEEVFDYLKRYYELIGAEAPDYACASTGVCTYDIKGFYLPNKGNVNEQLNIKNLNVRLMQCGSGDGYNYGGTFGKPLEGEELIPFENYILGVAYMEIGGGAPPEATKAQLVAARSFILARHVDLGGWRTITKDEKGKWIIQVAACNLDQGFCNPDLGCSYDKGKQIHSGNVEGSISYRPPLAQNAVLRTLAKEVEGELLVNAQGYVTYTGYSKEEISKFIALANQGLDYKQILMQVYNNGNRNVGVTDIKKSSCGELSTAFCSMSTGEFSNWKQGDSKWGNIPMGNSGMNIRQIGCLVTSVSMLIAKSGVPVDPSIKPLNPGTFVQFLNSHGGFSSGGNFNWAAAQRAAPSFVYQGKVYLNGMSRNQKFNQIKSIISQPGVYAVAEVKGNTGQHWVAIDGINGNTVNMMDPSSNSRDMWAQYNWANTSQIAYYKVSR